MADLEGHDGNVRDNLVNSDETKILTVGDGVVKLWKQVEHARWENVDILEGHSRIISSATLDPTESHVLTASYDGTARVWSVSDTAETAEYARFERPIHVSENGESFVTR